MPAINFPAAPSLNQTFTAGAITYTWDGEKWLAGVAAGAAGATGATGLTGTAGAQGATGATGLTGGATYSVTNSGASAYTINGNTNPTISLLRGFTYYFAVAASGHPFWIKTAAVTGTGSAYTSGVTNNGVDSGTVTFQVPFDAPATLYYICQFHSSMVGTLSVTDTGPAGATGATGVGATGATGIQGDIGATGPAGTSANISVYDETTLVTNSVTGLKFVGAGIAASLVSGNVEVTVTATGTGGSGGGFVYSNTAPVTANVGDRWINSETLTSFTYINDGDSSQWIETVTRSSGALNRDMSNLSNIVAINANLTPNADSTINLGAPDRRFKDLYLSGNTLYLGSATLSATGSVINLPAGTTVGGQNIASSGDVSTGGGPKIANLQVATAAWAVLDDTAVDITGGYVIVTGTNFVNGALVYFNQTPATSVAFVSATTLQVTVPALTAGTYIVYVINPDGGTAIRVPGLTSSANPTWQTGSALPEQYDGEAISLSLVATEATTYTLISGALPPGLSLNSNTGVITGTVTGVTVDTTYTFAVRATDAQLQDSPRTFTVTITVSDAYFKSTTLLLSGSAISANTVIRDSSTNNFNLTVYGDSRASNFTPYGGAWSVYFDGTGDYLTTPSNTAFTFGTGDFTVEAWVYVTGTNYCEVYTTASGSFPTTAMRFMVTNAQKLQFYDGTNSATSTGSVLLNSWTHVALSRSGTSVKLFINGTQDGTTTSSNNLTQQIGYIGRTWDSIDFTGYISNLRIVKGTAVYTANFTPATTNLTAVANTSLLTCNANRFIDSSTNNFAITRNGDARVVSFNPFNITNTGINGSAYFDGTGDYLSAGSNSAFSFGTGSYTVECWVYPSSISQQIYVVNDTTNGSVFYFETTGSVGFTIAPRAGSAIVSGGYSSLIINSWNHIVFVRGSTAANQTSIFVNGTRVANGTDSTNWTITGPCLIGGLTVGSYMMTGYLSNTRIVKGSAVYDPTQTTLTVPTSPLTAIANTQLLTLQYRQPHNNHTFLDSSSNQFLITRNGNASQGTFSPFSPGGWSYYFDGSSSYVGFEGGGTLQLHTGDLTIEFWFNMGKDQNISQGQGPSLMRKSTSSISYGRNIQWMIGTWTDGSMGFSMYNYDTGIGVGTNGLDVGDNQWHHAAFTRQGDTLRSFFDGQLRQTATFTGSANSTDWTTYIGANDATNVNPYKGYLSNVRILKGTALYTANFTPSTSSLQDIANCSLLTANSNRFRDTSSLNQTASPSGTNYVIPFSPFAPTAVYNPTTHGGSGYFDGTGDFLTIPSNNAFVFGTGDFTIESWAYLTAAPVSPLGSIVANGGNSTVTTNISFNLYITSALVPSLYIGTSTTNSITLTSSTAITIGAWNHIAATRSGNTFTLWLNGVSVATGTSSVNISALLDVFVSKGYSDLDNRYITGYISDLRLTKGQARYTSNFTPPTAPLTAVANTSLLLNFTDAAILDSTGRNILETVADAKTSSVVTKFTGGSMYFDGSGDILSSPGSQNYVFNGDFTVEGWVYIDSTMASSRPDNLKTFIFVGWNTGNTPQLYVYGTTSTAGIGLGYYDSTSSWEVAATVPKDQWAHIAYARTGSALYGFVNGTRYTINASISATIGSANTFVVGGNPNQVTAYYSYLKGNINDLRITKGYARYTSNFTAPTAPVRLK